MVVRNGIDMAFSTNQQQVAVWGPTAFDEPDMQADAPASLRYWCHVHRRIADLKEREPDRTLIVSFDQLCQDPSPAPRVAPSCASSAVPRRTRIGETSP